jgi:hypothetical protein
MSTEFAIASVPTGKLNALVKKVMLQTGQTDANEAIRLINSGEWIVSLSPRLWHEEEGVIYFSVTSDGATGEDWIKRLEDNGFYVGGYAKRWLRSSEFNPTSGVTTEVAVLKGILFQDNNRTTWTIRAEADNRKLGKPNAELACLIREKFTNEGFNAMGLISIVAMHEYFADSGIGTGLLDANCIGGGRRLGTDGFQPVSTWYRDYGFAFAVSQVSSQL